MIANPDMPRLSSVITSATAAEAFSANAGPFHRHSEITSFAAQADEHLPLKATSAIGKKASLKLHRLRDFGEVSNGHFAARALENPPISENGTSIAKIPILGHRGKSAGGTARGGARNRSDRESETLSAKQIGNLLDATHHSKAIGLPFTRMITIHWEAAGVPANEMAAATGKYLDLLTKALRRWGSGTSWLWVHEGGPGKGGHCHILIHVPAHLVVRVTNQQKKWLRRITGQKYRRKVIKSVPIGHSLGIESRNPDIYAINHDTVVGYLLKGASAEAIAKYGLQCTAPSGRIVGKRCGTSQNIGPKARASWRGV